MHLIPIVALLLALLTPAPTLRDAQVILAGGALTASWSPPAGQALVCGLRVAPLPAEPLEPCLWGDGPQLALAIPRDVGLLIHAGDTVELRAYDRRGALLASARVVVADRWRVWLPVTGKFSGQFINERVSAPVARLYQRH